MITIAVVAAWYGASGIRVLAMFIVLGMMAEWATAFFFDSKVKWTFMRFIGFLAGGAWLILMFHSAYVVSGSPITMLLLLAIISCADIGAWFFGKRIGGDKMWEKISPGKTWSGQIFGIICGTLAAIAVGFYVYGGFAPKMVWMGIGVSLLSQYGDLTASFVKRKLGLKDWSKYIPGHGGILDRFDGWIYVLPIVGLMMMS